jgi:hypothetical protein
LYEGRKDYMKDYIKDERKEGRKEGILRKQGRKE